MLLSVRQGFLARNAFSPLLSQVSKELAQSILSLLELQEVTMGTTKPRNPRDLDIIEGGRKRASDTFLDKNSVSCT